MTDRGRFITRALMFLCLGAIINVAVAWWLGWRVRYQLDSMLITDVPMEPGEFVASADWPNELQGPAGLFVSRTRQFGADHVLVQRVTWSMRWADRPVVPLESVWPRWGPLAGREPHEVYESITIPLGHTARGWPMLSMWCEFEQGTHGPVRGGYHLGHKQTPDTFIVTDLVLPLRPIWTGFAINTLFYGSIAWGLVAVPLALRRRLRIRHGLCAACAYPVGASPVCTECGERVVAGFARRL